MATHRDSWNFVNSKTAVYLGESKTPNDGLILSNVTFQIDDKFINFTKESSRWQAQYSFVNRESEWQKQVEIRRQEEIKKEQDRIKAEQLKKEAEAKAAIVKKQAEERAATAKKDAEEQQARLEKEAQEKDRREAIINGIKLVALFTFIAAIFFYLYKFQKDKIMQLYSKLKTKKKTSLQKNLDNKKDPKHPNEVYFDWKTTEGKIFLPSAVILLIWITYMVFFGYSGGTKARLIIERPYGQGAFGPTNIECVYKMWDSEERVVQYLPYGSIGGCPKYLE
jgi:flagellar biosynthesis GTPase FlhF